VNKRTTSQEKEAVMAISNQRARDTFVTLADTLVAEFDIIEFLDMLAERCVELLGVAAAGLLLVDHRGTLNLVAASTEQARLLELFQLQNQEGPCLDCYRIGQPVSCPDLADAIERWPLFAPAAAEAGFAAVHALPMQLRQEVIGGLNLFSTEPSILDADAVGLGQALANVATIGILHERTVRHGELVVEQLQTALNSRIAVEQAKGVLAERLQVTVADAFTRLRGHARRTNQRLVDLATAVVNGSTDIADIAAATASPIGTDAAEHPAAG
jgi:transcriptional regulator with GAF, ATPase, and Fis domain